MANNDNKRDYSDEEIKPVICDKDFLGTDPEGALILLGGVEFGAGSVGK